MGGHLKVIPKSHQKICYHHSELHLRGSSAAFAAQYVRLKPIASFNILDSFAGGRGMKLRLSVFNVGLELRKRAIADGLGFIHDDDPEHAITILILYGGDGSPASVSPEA